VRSLARRRIVAPPSAELLVAAALTVGFLAVTAWWLKHDSRVPDFDNGKHLGDSFYYYDLLHQGLLEPFKVFTTYPPLLHLVGALGVAVGGVGVRGPIMVENVVFVPLLAAGCYGAGTVAAEGRRLGGLLAVVFALGTPMVVSQLHVMMLDAPEAAMATTAAAIAVKVAVAVRAACCQPRQGAGSSLSSPASSDSRLTRATGPSRWRASCVR